MRRSRSPRARASGLLFEIARLRPRRLVRPTVRPRLRPRPRAGLPRALPRAASSSISSLADHRAGRIGDAEQRSASSSGASSGSSISTCFCMPRTSASLSWSSWIVSSAISRSATTGFLSSSRSSAQRRAGGDLARPLRGEQHQLEPVRDLDNTIFDGNPRHSRPPSPAGSFAIYGPNRRAGNSNTAATRHLRRRFRRGGIATARLTPLGRARLYQRRISPRPAGWQSGYATDCKSVYSGSIPLPASST